MIEKIDTIKDVVAAFEHQVIVKNYQTTDSFNHEEADSRLVLHVYDIGNCSIDRVMIKTVDTDVLVLAIALFPKLNLVD